MRILYLSPCAQLGGAERCLLDLLASLKQSEPDWPLHLIAGHEGPLIPEALRLGVEAQVLRLPQQVSRLSVFGSDPVHLIRDCMEVLPGAASYCNRLWSEIRRIAPDIVHTNGFKMHLLAAWTSSAPVVWHLHDYVSHRPFSSRALRLSSYRIRGAIGVSESVAADAQLAFGDRLPVEAIPNAVDLARFHPSGQALDLRTDPRFIRAGLVGTFARWKGHEVFLRALAEPEVRALDLRGFVIGGPIYETENSQHSIEELRELARSLDLEDRVSFTGFVPDPAAAMRALDIVVHASTSPEPFGLVIAEAMACGKAVVVADAGGASELFRDGEDAISSVPGDHRALALALARLAADPALRMRLGAEGRRTAEAKFNRDRLGPAISSFYQSILSGKPCASSTSTAAISTAA